MKNLIYQDGKSFYIHYYLAWFFMLTALVSIMFWGYHLFSEEEIDPVTGLVRAIYDPVTKEPVMEVITPADMQYDKIILLLDPDGTKLQAIINEFLKKLQ